jgi:hypothetical protein
MTVAAPSLLASTTATVALWLGLYASVVASLTGLWALFRELWVERPRILVQAAEGWWVKVKDQDKPLLIRGYTVADGRQALADIGDNLVEATEVLLITLRNKGRRDATIEHVIQRISEREERIFGDIIPLLPAALPGERSEIFVVGREGDHPHGTIGIKGFYVLDGAGRAHPLRMRYRLRLRRLLGQGKPRLPTRPEQFDASGV